MPVAFFCPHRRRSAPEALEPMRALLAGFSAQAAALAGASAG